MDNNGLWEKAVDELKDGINVLHLLRAELAENQDDEHIIRSVGIVLKILQSALLHLQQMEGD